MPADLPDEKKQPLIEIRDKAGKGTGAWAKVEALAKRMIANKGGCPRTAAFCFFEVTARRTICSPTEVPKGRQSLVSRICGCGSRVWCDNAAACMTVT